MPQSDDKSADPWRKQVTLSLLSGSALDSLAALRGIPVTKLMTEVLERYVGSPLYEEDRKQAERILALINDNHTQEDSKKNPR